METVSRLDFSRGSLYKPVVATPQGDFYLALGQKVRDARKAAKLTQALLAQAVGLTRTSITNIEKGRQPVYIHLLVKLADALGKDLPELIPLPKHTDQPGVAPKLRKLESRKREWVKRVIGSPESSPVKGEK
jgi:transcriptional regulator with XRE-family HTH domain